MIFGIPRSALVFSAKSFLAGMLALYVALLTGLENPAWSVVTAYIVAQPHAGAALSKAGYRLVGTFIGAWAAILMVPPLVHAPALLGLSIAAWLGACVFASLADRSPRGYLFALAGYTTCIVAYPVLSHPQDVFQQGMSRFEEIALGIVCSAMVHAIVFPVSTASVLHKRLETVLRDARQACIEALSPSPSARSGADRRKLATAIGELHELLLHQRFEGRHVGTQEQLVRPLLPRLERLIPLSLAVGDRLDELARLDRLDLDLGQLTPGGWVPVTLGAKGAQGDLAFDLKGQAQLKPAREAMKSELKDLNLSGSLNQPAQRLDAFTLKADRLALGEWSSLSLSLSGAQGAADKPTLAGTLEGTLKARLDENRQLL